MKIIIFLVMLNVDASTCHSLAPPPVNFIREEIRIGGKTYVVENKNGSISLKKKERSNILVMLAIIIALTFLFWFGFIFLFFWNGKLAIYVLIGLLLIFLVFHVLVTILNRRR